MEASEGNRSLMIFHKCLFNKYLLMISNT